MIFIQVLITGLAIFIVRRLYEFWRLGRSLGAVTHPPVRAPLLVEKKDLFRKTACLLGTLLLFIVGADTTVMLKSGHPRPDLFSSHVVIGVAMLCCFALMRLRTGDRFPVSHRTLGYITFVLFAYILITGLWFLWKL